MAIQYDFSSGLDLSGLTSVSQSQLMQAINQLAPLGNIGGVLWGVPADFPQAFITDNPRCARYVLVDTTAKPYTLKTWDDTAIPGAWVSATVGANAISDAGQIVDDLIPISKLLESEASARQVLRMNAGATAFEYVNPANLLTTGEVALNWLDITGVVAGQFLRYTAAGGVSWNSYDPTVDVNALPVNKLNTGSASQILRVNPSTGLPEWASNDDAISGLLAAGGGVVGINVSKLAASNSANGDLLKSDGTNWSKATPQFNIFGSAAFVDCSANMGTTGVTTVAHGLGSKPKIVFLVARCTSGDAGSNYAAGDFLLPEAFGTVTDTVFPVVTCYWNAVNIKFFVSAAMDRVRKESDGSIVAPTSFTNFTLRAYCIL